MHLVLLDSGQHWGLLGALPLVYGPENPVLQRLRLVPYIGQVLPPLPALDWGEVAVYRVTLRPLPDTSCDLCFMAELRDGM
jgi:hypothetical protein